MGGGDGGELEEAKWLLTRVLFPFFLDKPEDTDIPEQSRQAGVCTLIKLKLDTTGPGEGLLNA